jgi:glutamate 5-kinase
MHAYENAFNRSGLKVAQILLTREDLADRARYTNAHNTFNELFAYGIIPIVNENDSVAVEEIRFGDNDTLGVLVTYLCEADLLVILSDIDGFYTEDPRLNPKAQLVHEVERIDEAIERNARLSGSDVGTGGMQTKIRAAKSMMQSGLPMVIAHGRTPDVLNRVLAGERVGTFFGPSAGRMNSRKRWLAWSVPTRGTIVIDAGAQKALLEKNTSLLATGIKGIRGTWGRGAVVEITNDQGLRIAKGIVNHSAQELESIKGLRNAQIAEKFGVEIAREVVHIDDMVKW